MPKLTKGAVVRAKVRAKKYEISCSSTRGLILRVLPSGKKVFFFRQRRAGQDTRIRLGLFGDGSGDTLTLDGARLQVARLALMGASEVAWRREQTVPAQEPGACFAELAELFLRRHVETHALRESTRKFYRRAVAGFTKAWGARSLTSIRFADVEKFHRTNSHRPSAANNEIRVLHVMFEKAVQWELFDGRNPAHGIKYYRENKRKRYLRSAERRRLDNVLSQALARKTAIKGKSGTCARWSHIYAIRLLLLTGMRMSEVLDLRWTWIFPDRLEIILPNSKTGESVRPISPAVLDLLDEIKVYRKSGVPFVVYGQHDQRIHSSSLRDTWSRLRKAARIEDVRIHDLRHSAASAAISSGCSLAEVGAILGHKTPATTARYAHLSAEAARAAARRMTDAILRDQGGGRAKRRTKQGTSG